MWLPAKQLALSFNKEIVQIKGKQTNLNNLVRFLLLAKWTEYGNI
jgi:hypothetical protein